MALALLGCRSGAEGAPEACDERASRGDLVINEAVSKNDGVWIDEFGATEDYVELVNRSERALDLQRYVLSDSGASARLPDRTMDPGQRILVWLDDDEEEGEFHLPFKLSSAGEGLRVSTCGSTIDAASVPELKANESYSRFPDGAGELSVCRYATPTRANGEDCSAPTPQGLPTDVEFEEFDWPESHPPLPEGLVLSELHLRPNEGETPFVELVNLGTQTVELGEHRLTFAPLHPGESYPGRGSGDVIELGAEGTVAPGEYHVVELQPEDFSQLDASPEFEGVVTLFDESSVLDRVDFMRWPDGASLARPHDRPERFVFCTDSTASGENECEILASRDVGDRVRGLRTSGDFAALSQGGVNLGTSAVKFIVDVEQGDAVHFLRAFDWALHYTFVREVILGEPPLDRCDPEERAAFNTGWYDFSATEYFSPEGRSFYLGTLVKHGSTGHQTVEHALGDVIVPDDIRKTFFNVTERVLAPESWAMRPQNEEQVQKALQIEGELPLLPTNAPFADLSYQPLTHGVGYGVLTFVPADELHSTALGAQAILVTDDVPNDIPLVGGLITQAFQTPLAHVNVLSQNRGTPNMALRGAVDDERITELLGELVRLDVGGDQFSIELAEPEEAAAFWAEFVASGPLQAPRLDLEQTNLVDLTEASLGDLPAIGAKAAQVAELYRVEPRGPEVCGVGVAFDVPDDAFAVPVAHFITHFEDSGARVLYDELSSDARFDDDPLARAESLAAVQALILEHPVDEALLSDLESEIGDRFGGRRVRLRSSSNAEDLPGFNGAGLYTSASAELDNPERAVDDALRTVWASLFNPRAYDERELARVEHTSVAMGVLVHEAFTTEIANGVGVSRNVLEPIRGDIYYLNTQAGEASVTNPAPGVTTEATKYQWPPRSPLRTFLSQSSFTRGEPVMTEGETVGVACALLAIHDHFQPLLDPDGEDPWFAMEIEFKLNQPDRNLIVKQARPHAFGGFDVAGDCREF